MLPLGSVQRQREADLTGIKSYEIFCSHIDGVLALYPKLSKTLDSNGKEVIIGEIDLIDGDQKHWDTYQISIHWRENYPYQFPAVHETGDKIPKVPDWHIYSNTGWIYTSRQKTDTSTRIPLLPPALEILDRYKDDPQCINEERLLPVLSNQKMNASLKEIADLCGITWSTST